MSRVHIIGGGFSGLTLAYYLIKQGKKVDIFEKSNQLGGMLSSELTQNGLVESAANGLLNSSFVEDLFADLNIKQAERVTGKPTRYIYRNGLKKWPLNMPETGRFFKGACSYVWNKNKDIRLDETLREWVSRKFGAAAFDYLLSPGVQGIYGTSDLDAELIHRAASRIRQQASGHYNKVRKGTVAPEGGMRELIIKLKIFIEENEGVIHLNANGDVRRSHPTVVATSATSASLLLLEEAPQLSRSLALIEYLPLTSVTCFFNGPVKKINAFGCLFPKKEKFHFLGVLFNNSIFKNRAIEHSETWIIDQAGLSESELLYKINEDRKKMLGVEDKIISYKINDWPYAIPCYNKVLREVIDEIELPPQVYLTGNYLGAIGLGKILEMNMRLAKQICDEMV